MPNTAQINFSVTDLSFSVAAILQGISFAEGITKRGPFADAELLITTWDQFLKLYGGYLDTSDFPLLCKRAFDRGAQLRINRVGHYTDITSAATLDAVKADLNKTSILTFDAALIVANQFDVDVNGLPIVAETFAVDSDTTMVAIAAAIALNADVAEAFVISGGVAADDDRVIMVISNSNTPVLLTNEAVTLGASQAGVVASQPAAPKIIDAVNNDLFTLRPKYEGVDYNNLSVTISDASNGNANFFNLAIQHALEPSLDESYPNLTIVGTPTVVESDYLSSIQTGSSLMDVTYLDLSAETAPLRPRNQSYYYRLGSDGGVVLATDYIGDPGGKNGLHAFDAVDDGLQVAIPEVGTTAVNTAGAAYAAARKDLNFYAHIPNTKATAAALMAERDLTLIDTRFCAIFAGGLKITSPLTSLPIEISEMGDILGIMAFNDTEAAEWYSPAGTKRGKIPNALGVVNNFGTPASFNDLNSLANRQINMVIVRKNRIYLVDAFTAQLANSKLSHLNVQRFLLFLEKSLAPTLESFIEEPLDVPLFKEIFNSVEPFLDSLVTDRALFSYRWQGDQDVDTIDDIVINDATDLDNGKYAVRLFVKVIPALKEFGIDIVVTPTGTSFELI